MSDDRLEEIAEKFFLSVCGVFLFGFAAMVFSVWFLIGWLIWNFLYRPLLAAVGFMPL